MSVTTITEAVSPDPVFRARVERELGEAISPCFHCSKCSSGCPITFAMDLTPNRVVRAVQMGAAGRVLSSRTIWLCASCQTCTTRCPNAVDIARMMDVLRRIAIDDGVPPAEPEVPLFHRRFLASVRKRGRVFEAGALFGYKLRSRNRLQDIGLGWRMLLKGKLGLWPARVRRKGEVSEIFDRSERGEGGGR